jgi:hypothetical protein
MRASTAVARQPRAEPYRPARRAITGGLASLRHWSSALSLLAIVPVAHLLARHGAGDPTGAVFGASFAVFALLLPAVALLRDYIDRRISRLREVLQQRAAAEDSAQPADDDSTGILEAQRTIFGSLAEAVAPLQRGIVLTIMATIASAAAVIAPSSILWKHAPGWLVFSPTELLTALALVCLVGAVAAMLPFTWYLLIPSEEIDLVRQAIDIETEPPAAGTGGGQPPPPAGELGRPLRDGTSGQVRSPTIRNGQSTAGPQQVMGLGVTKVRVDPVQVADRDHGQRSRVRPVILARSAGVSMSSGRPVSPHSMSVTRPVRARRNGRAPVSPAASAITSGQCSRARSTGLRGCPS